MTFKVISTFIVSQLVKIITYTALINLSTKQIFIQNLCDFQCMFKVIQDHSKLKMKTKENVLKCIKAMGRPIVTIWGDFLALWA